MSIRKEDRVLERFLEECTRCDLCIDACELLKGISLTPGEIADLIMQDQVNDELLAAILRCDLCGRCCTDCPENLNLTGLMKSAREFLIRGGRISCEDYDVMLVNREWNFFSLYRETYGIHYNDLLTTDFETLFFPGCSLAAYSSELTRAAYDWLKGRGIRLGFSELCCGKPLECIGLRDEADQYLNQLRRLLQQAGARSVITACPGCKAQLKKFLPEIEIQSIYTLLLEGGIHLSGSQRLTFHDSCPDRFGSQNPQTVRLLLSGYPQVEMASRGENTICCGSGGIVSMIDAEICSARAFRRASEFLQSGASACMTSCMSCAYRLARVMDPGQVRHCLELVFGIQVDYAQVDRNCSLMWAGSQGEVNAYRLYQSREQIQNNDNGVSQ